MRLLLISFEAKTRQTHSKTIAMVVLVFDLTFHDLPWLSIVIRNRNSLAFIIFK